MTAKTLEEIEELKKRTFGFLTPIGPIPGSGGRWNFKCECGRVKALFFANVVTQGSTKSCGCKKNLYRKRKQKWGTVGAVYSANYLTDF